MLHNLFLYTGILVFFRATTTKFHGGTIVMTRRYFWQIPELIKYRTVFENVEIVNGTNEENEHKLFRKDTGRICFDEAAAVLQSSPAESPAVRPAKVSKKKAGAARFRFAFHQRGYLH